VFVTAGLAAVVFLLMSTAWFQIQSVRWSYRVQSLRVQLDDLEKKEQTVDQRLQGALALARLDELAKTRYRLQVPDPSQIVLVADI
jgi:hypothetical protein